MAVVVVVDTFDLQIWFILFKNCTLTLFEQIVSEYFYTFLENIIPQTLNRVGGKYANSHKCDLPKLTN